MGRIHLFFQTRNFDLRLVADIAHLKSALQWSTWKCEARTNCNVKIAVFRRRTSPMRFSLERVISAQPTSWSRCCVVVIIVTLLRRLSPLSGFEQPGNLRVKKLNVNRKAWNCSQILSGWGLFAQNKSTIVVSSWLEGKYGSSDHSDRHLYWTWLILLNFLVGQPIAKFFHCFSSCKTKPDYQLSNLLSTTWFPKISLLLMILVSFAITCFDKRQA